MDAVPASNESSNTTGVKQTTPATSQSQPTSETTNTPDACKTTRTDANESKVPNASVQNGNEASKPISSEPAPPSLSATLQSQIQALLALHARMPALRAIPWKMVRSQTQSTQNSLLGVVQLAGSAAGVGLGVPPVSQGVRDTYKSLEEIREQLLKGDLQAALVAARESEAKDGLETPPTVGRRKRKRMTTADSPAAFPSFHIQPVKVFPPTDSADLTRRTLAQYIVESNKSRKGRMSLHIWARSRPKDRDRGGTIPDQSGLIVLRVTLVDVAIIYVKLTNRSDKDDILTVESAVAFGPREKKGPHSQSEFMVYQKLTQQILRMLRQEPYASLQQVLNLLESYEGLFITKCSQCQRILPQEGHVPPVGRVWKDVSIEGESSHWEARHITCLQV